MADFAVAPKSAKSSRAAEELAAEIAADGGDALAVFQEPVGGKWHVFAMLPLDLVEPTPYID